MKHFNALFSLLAFAAVAFTAPFAVGQFKKAKAVHRNFDTAVAAKAGISPLTQPLPTPTAETVESTGPRLRGLVVNSNVSYIGEFSVGENLTVTAIKQSNEFDASGSAFYADGKFYMQYAYEEYMVPRAGQTIYDAETWEIIEDRKDLLLTSAAVCITYDPLDCAAYGYFRNDGEQTIVVYGKMNLATGEVDELNSVYDDDGFMCIAAAPDGWLYGVNVSGQFCRINKKNGEITVLGHTDVKPYYIQSAVIDWATGKFYWAGMTDTGKSSLYEIDPVTYIAKKISDFPQNQEIVGLYVVDESPAGQKAAAVENLTASFDKASLSGIVSFKASSSTVDGSPLKGDVKAHVAVGGNHYEANTIPGAECTFDVKVDFNDLYSFSAWISDENGNGVKSNVQRWVGADHPGEPQNVKLVLENNKFLLTWEPPLTTGIHGGYVDIDEVTYTIGRDGGGFFRPVENFKGLSMEFDVPENVNEDIKFYVRAIYNETASSVAYSNSVYVGKQAGLDVPVDLNAADFTLFKVIDANDDGETWSKYLGCATCEGVDEGSDDWVISPSITLKKGVVYELSYNLSAKMGFVSPQQIEVKAGIGEAIDNLTIAIDEYTCRMMLLSKFETRTVEFTVPEDGVYNFGFHYYDTVGGTIGLGDISIKNLAASAGPAAPASLNIVAAEEGRLEADIEFVAPSKDSEGIDLTELGAVEVYRNKTLVGSVENPIPGQKYSVHDRGSAQGLNDYEVVAVDKSGISGMKATVRGWVGLDIPQTPENVDMVEQDGKLIITWTLPEKGTHDGYVNPAEVVYTLVQPTLMTELGNVVGKTSLIVDLGDATSQGAYSFGIVASNAVGTNYAGALTPTVVAGPAYSLPFIEHFTDGRVNYSWHLVGEAIDDDSGWTPTQETGPDGESGISSFWGMWDDEKQSLVTGKISLKKVENPVLRFYTLFNASKDFDGITLSVGVSETLSGTAKIIYSKEYTEAGTNSGWLPVEISLKEFVGKDVFINFTASPEYGSALIGIDDVSISEPFGYDASVESISIDTDEVEVGVSTAKVNIRVQNHGTKDLTANSYKIGFYAGERRFALIDGKEMKAAWGQTKYEAEYTPDVDDTDPAIITARIESDIDENSGNNVSKEVQTYVVKPVLPEVTDLSGEEVAEGIALKWSQPDQSGLPVRMVLDDFESYRTFDIDRADDWTIIDEDKSPGVCVSYFFPGSADAKGWVVMAPAEIPRYDGGTNADRIPAYSGEKMMAAYSPQSGDNSDWLITPELSGRAHEISFMARAESAKQGREMFEVYYSTTGKTLADMKRLDNVDYRTALEGWSEFKFQVPEGAKYFAVRCVSHSRLCMHIDDFRYESAPTPLEVKFVGYNVYRDGHRVNDEVITASSWLDSKVTEGENHDYTVRVVYDRGESAHSNKVTLSVSGLSEISVTGAGNDTWYNLQGRKATEDEKGIMIKKGAKVLRK